MGEEIGANSQLPFTMGDALPVVARHVFCLLQSKGRGLLEAILRDVSGNFL